MRYEVFRWYVWPIQPPTRGKEQGGGRRELYKYKNIQTIFTLNHVSFMLANGEMHINVFSNKNMLNNLNVTKPPWMGL